MVQFFSDTQYMHNLTVKLLKLLKNNKKNRIFKIFLPVKFQLAGSC